MCVCVCVRERERDEPLSIVPIRAKVVVVVFFTRLLCVDVSGARFWLRVSVVHFFFSLSLVLIIPVSLSLSECERICLSAAVGFLHFFPLHSFT